MNTKIKRTVLLLPVQNLTANEEFASLAFTIYNVFQINLKNQESLDLIPYSENDFNAADTDGIEGLIKRTNEIHNAETCIISEYYVAVGTLHITITVIDTISSRIKNCFIKTMPSDQGRYEVLDSMISEISDAIAKDLPAIERDAHIRKQIIARLQQKLDSEEKLLNEVLKKKHEITFLPLTGVHLGRTVIAWTEKWPLLALPIGLEYSFFFLEQFHLRTKLEYLPFYMMMADTAKTELGFDILFGIHTNSLFSFSIDIGLGITYDENSNCTALSKEGDEIEPPATRLSISIPVIFGLSFYFHKTFFMNFRLAHYGLTYTIETSDPSDYTGGSSSLKYYNGFSPFNFICLSLTTSIGVRF